MRKHNQGHRFECFGISFYHCFGQIQAHRNAALATVIQPIKILRDVCISKSRGFKPPPTFAGTCCYSRISFAVTLRKTYQTWHKRQQTSNHAGFQNDSSYGRLSVACHAHIETKWMLLLAFQAKMQAKCAFIGHKV